MQGLCVFNRRALLPSLLFHSLGWNCGGGVAATALGMKFGAHSAARKAVLSQTHTRTLTQRDTFTSVRAQDETEWC